MKQWLARAMAVCALGVGMWPAAGAMTLERVGADLFATGPTVDADFLAFKEALAKAGLQRLILVNGPGGDLWTGMRVARMVQDAKLTTVVSGHCMSACSLIFMAGRERAFGTGSLPRLTLLGIHGPHNKESKRVDPQQAPQMYALYKMQMGDKFDSEVINQALYGMQDAQGFLRMRELERTEAKDRTPWFCPSGQTPHAQCAQLQGKDALSLGVVTQAQTVALTLPESMKVALGFYGRKLPAPTQELAHSLPPMIDAFCQGNEACTSRAGTGMQRYLQAQTEKAFAVGMGKLGFGWVHGADLAGPAMLRALYLCNHAKDNPKLCHLAAVNEHVLLPYYDENASQSAAKLKQLKAPTSAQVQEEKNEVGGSAPQQLRMAQDMVGLTPKALEGIARWDTADVVRALQSAPAPVVIDVGTIGPMLPGALHFVNAGARLADDAQDAAYAQRFAHMLKAAAPDPAQPVVFYCTGSNCWLSVNAAMRARQLGYSQVKWYRYGMSGWLQAGLPTVDRVPVAVIH